MQGGGGIKQVSHRFFTKAGLRPRGVRRLTSCAQMSMIRFRALAWHSLLPRRAGRSFDMAPSRRQADCSVMAAS
jgi:hypothetical protein